MGTDSGEFLSMSAIQESILAGLAHAAIPMKASPSARTMPIAELTGSRQWHALCFAAMVDTTTKRANTPAMTSIGTNTAGCALCATRMKIP
eukprot:COSAG02_NODE_978_length_15497_cov_11.288349_13_plen_91_part_00